MSYQVLARKWRPKNFHEMVGQEHVLKALINALDNGRLHHAYLFTGTRGVGKTTIARILAKCLNCDVGVSSEPCGTCSACESINEGRFVDLIEVDAASRTKVEDTRELLENVQYAPTTGRYKVYLIDEVHMLSNHSFNALLKTLEEPPPHVKFLLATTDPQKLPATILSRCLQFNLKNMTPERIVGHLQHVLTEETIAYEDQALWLLGRSADGSMRDALSLTDQAVSFGSGQLLENDVRSMLGTIDRTMVHDIIVALADADGAKILEAVQRLSEHAPDYSAALEELLTQLHRIAIAQAVPGTSDNSLGDKEQLDQLAGRLAAEDVQLFYQLGLAGRRDLPHAPDPRNGFEMVLLRMLAFRPAGISELPQNSLKSAVRSTPTSGEGIGLEVPQSVKKSELSSPSSNGGLSSRNVELASENYSENDAIVDKAVVTNPAVDAVMVTRAPSSSSGVASKPEASPHPELSEVKSEVLKAEVLSTSPNRQPSIEPPAAAQEVSSEGGSDDALADKNIVLNSALSSVEPDLEGGKRVTLSDLTPERWLSHFEQLDFGGVVGNIASHCVLERVSGDALFLQLDEANATLFSDSYTDRIQAHLSVALNAPVSVKIKVMAVSGETPATRKARLIKERKQQALICLQNDPNIQTLINEFDAILDADSVEPL